MIGGGIKRMFKDVYMAAKKSAPIVRNLPACVDWFNEQCYNKITRKVILLNRRKDLELVYASETIKSQCTNIKAARKLFHAI